MANYLKVNMKETIKTLEKKGWSIRRIAKELGVHRNTVRRYTLENASKCTIPTAGSGAVKEPSKCTISTAGASGRKSLCDAYGPFIRPLMEKGLSAQRIFQDLKLERGFLGSYESVKRYVRKFARDSELPFRRMEVGPGAEVQVDYGTGAWVVDENGKRSKTHLFRIVLSCSRAGYSEVTSSQSTENFLRSLENAFRYFGGVPSTVVIDNLKAGVIKPCIYDPDLNPKLRDFAEHYGTCILPSKVATPRHKGKVENSVKYVQSNALKGRKFASIQEQNEFLSSWESRVANTRIHGTVKRQVGEMFAEEKPHLSPLPAMLFPCFQEGSRTVHRDGHVEVEKSYYSVPPEYVRREVWVRFTSRTVDVFNHRMEKIACHARAEVGKFSTHSYHVPREKIANPEHGNRWLLQQADQIGCEAGAWARAMLANRGIPGTRVLNGLLQQGKKHTGSAINSGCKLALDAQEFHLKGLRQFIEKSFEEEQQNFAFLEEHPLIREMSEYELPLNTKELFA
jgi:transposase